MLLCIDIRFLAQIGKTALIYAAWKGRADCVRVLLNAGADKEAKSLAAGQVRIDRCVSDVRVSLFYLYE